MELYIKHLFIRYLAFHPRFVRIVDMPAKVKRGSIPRRAHLIFSSIFG